MPTSSAEASPQRHVAILSVHNDLHALVIQMALEEHGGITCQVVETDRLSGSASLSWSDTEEDGIGGSLPTRDGAKIDVSTLDLVWWRRVNYPQQVPVEIVDEAQLDLINNDCRATLLGSLLNEFRGTWVSDPNNTRIAENKLIQLRVARQVG